MSASAAKILIVDDRVENIRLLVDLLQVKGYSVLTAQSGPEALGKIESESPDLVLLDVAMPGMSGYEVCSKIRQNPSTAILPVVMVTAVESLDRRTMGLEAGADDFLIKPINHIELMARVASLLRIKSLYDTVQEQGRELAQWNRLLEQRVADQLAQLERLSRLKRFFSPQLAELIVSDSAQDPLASHRREITVVFLDLRGFTTFAETAEPEDVMRVLSEYQTEMGQRVLAYEGTLERFTGDGMMVFFNDPVPIFDPVARAVRMALEMRERVKQLSEQWRKLGYDLDFGVGIAQGYATVGAIGFEGRWDYAAIGTVTNLASRLCSESKPGQILIAQRVATAAEAYAELERVPDLTLKGFLRPVAAYNVISPRTSANPL